MDEEENSREEVSWSDLPEDVMCRVLARLPVRKLVQVRTVCKQWNSIITSSCFEELWTEQTSSSSSSQEAAAYFPLLLCPGGGGVGGGGTHYHEFCLAYDHTANQWQRMPSLSFLPPGVRIPMTGAGGLLCFRRDTSLFLCNPLTKAIQELPVIARNWIHYASVHLIVDKRAKAFKVIVAGKLRHNSSSSSSSSLTDAFGSIAIFESSSCSCSSSSSSSSASAAGGGWRSIDSLPPKVFSYGRTAAMCKGFIYCEAICCNGKVGVAAYDVERERWNDVIHQVPPDDNADYELSDVVECGGWIWMVVGRGYGGIITRIYILKLLLLGVTATTPPPLPHPLSQQAAAGVLTLLPADANSFSNNQEEEEIAQQDCCWRRVTDLPNELLDKLRDVWFGEDESSLAIVAHGSRICIAAGKSLMLVYNIIHDSWSILPPFSPWHWKAIDTYGGAEPTSFPVELSFSCPLQTN
ncbi:unnamed protein product [Sphagnum tenellum]